MPFIDPLPTRRMSLFARLVALAARRRLGRVPAFVGILARHPGVLAGAAVFEGALDKRAHVVPARLKELAALRAATLVGCPF
jgi:alkylhydroperoxidase family enzyme